MSPIELVVCSYSTSLEHSMLFGYWHIRCSESAKAEENFLLPRFSASVDYLLFVPNHSDFYPCAIRQVFDLLKYLTLERIMN